MNGGTCGSCAYYFQVDKTSMCRKSPPKVFIVGVLPPLQGQQEPRPLIQSFFAPVTKAMWCGEYKSKGAPPGAA